VRDVAGGYLSHNVEYLESWKTEDLRRFIVSEEGGESGRREDQISDISDGWDCIKLFKKVARYSGRIVLETLNRVLLWWEMKLLSAGVLQF
jgi:hypothetical protein